MQEGMHVSAGVQLLLRDEILLFALLKPDADEERCWS
jgi:hypothetical protein